MKGLRTIATFTYPAETFVIKSKLESEGIECFIKDELTIQSHNFLSNAIGGLKLQVNPNDVEKAIGLLKESGYKIEDEIESSKFLIKLDNLTNKFPLINKAKVEYRFIILSISIILIFIPIIYFALLQSTFSFLTDNEWCLDRITHDGVAYRPRSIFKLEMPGYCNESISFDPDGKINIPGFNSNRIMGKWELKDDILTVIEVDNFKQIFQNDFKVIKTHNTLILKSEMTTIFCNLDNF